MAECAARAAPAASSALVGTAFPVAAATASATSVAGALLRNLYTSTGQEGGRERLRPDGWVVGTRSQDAG